MKNIKYLILFFGAICAAQSHARDGHLLEQDTEMFSVRHPVDAAPTHPSEEVLEDDLGDGPTPTQLLVAQESVVLVAKEMTLADVLMGLKGESADLLKGWSSKKMSDFLVAFNAEYEALKIKDKKNKLENLQRDLENIQASKKKKKGKAARIKDLEERIKALEGEVAGFVLLEDQEKMGRIKLDLESSSQDGPWMLSVKLKLRSESGIPPRFLAPITAGLKEYLVDI